MKAWLPVLLFSLGASASLAGQTGMNLLTNGGFEETQPRENLWDGIDSDGFLAGATGTVPLLDEKGRLVDTAMPLSVVCADLNSDGLKDLVTADANGTLRAYFNSGTPTEPKFSAAETIPVFLSHKDGEKRPYVRRAPRIDLADFARRGLLDLVVGNYLGELFFISNTGSPRAPDFKQPAPIEKALVKTSRSGRLSMNLLAPAAADFNRDGKPDIVLGEGSYSANAIHLLLNRGAGLQPEFDEQHTHLLAFGDGREQLSPAVVDYNGDGWPDLLVADRAGQIAVHLHPGSNWKPGDEFPFASFVTPGGKARLGQPVTVYAADLNGDGLFDLILGETNGRVAVAWNHGSRKQPQFDAPVELKGRPPGEPTLATPKLWRGDDGSARGTFYGYIGVVDAARDPGAEPPEGRRVLKAGYVPSPNKVFRKPDAPAGTGTFSITKGDGIPLKPGAVYTLSFKVKGVKAQAAKWELTIDGYKERSPARVIRGERNSAEIKRDEAREELHEGGDFSPGPAWTTVSKTFTVSFKDKDLRGTDSAAAKFQISFELAQGEGVLYVDDVRLVRR